MQPVPKTKWLHRGNFWIRLLKETLVIYPVALFMSYFGFVRFRLMGDFTVTKWLAFATVASLVVGTNFAYGSRFKAGRYTSQPFPPVS